MKTVPIGIAKLKLTRAGEEECKSLDLAQWPASMCCVDARFTKQMIYHFKVFRRDPSGRTNKSREREREKNSNSAPNQPTKSDGQQLQSCSDGIYCAQNCSCTRMGEAGSVDKYLTLTICIRMFDAGSASNAIQDASAYTLQLRINCHNPEKCSVVGCSKVSE